MSFKFRLFAFRPSRLLFSCCERSAAQRLATKLLSVEPRYNGRAVYGVHS